MNDMNGVLTAASKNFRSIGGNFTNFYRPASPFDRVSQEIYSQQAFYMPLRKSVILRDSVRGDNGGVDLNTYNSV
jgi:hypothetical protein